MEQLVQCPVCTLYLHNGMSLESHLDTHPKDQVIRALCSLSANKTNYSSRSSTPSLSEKSYRSGSRTPALEDNVQRWGSAVPDQVYWRKLPGRVPHRQPARVQSRTPKVPTTQIGSPDVTIGELTFENVNANLSGLAGTLFSSAKSVNSDKPPNSEQYSFIHDHKEDVEIKYSRSVEYNSPNNAANVFASSPTPTIKLQQFLPSTARRNNDFVNINVVNNRRDFLNTKATMKTDLGPVQYIPTGGNPMQVMMSTSPALVKSHNNLILQTNSSQTLHKTVSSSILPPQFGQLTTSTLAPAKTVVAQNSQIIYREMVHSMENKSPVPGMGGDLTDNPRAGTMYHNVMFVNPPYVSNLPKVTPSPMTSTSYTKKNNSEPNKTLVIEIGPRLQQTPVCTQNSVKISKISDSINENSIEGMEVDIMNQNSLDSGVKILSNIKVEVPVQHHQSMVGKVVDLTDPEFVDHEYLLSKTSKEIYLQSSPIDEKLHTNTFSVIKNVGNPPTYKDPSKHCVDNKLSDMESADSCPVPDLICNEKPSISPCSELSENGDNAIDHMSTLSPKRNMIKKRETENLESSNKDELPQKPYWNQSSGSNNVFMKKPKKVLQIKNSKFPKQTPSCSRASEPCAADVRTKKYLKMDSFGVNKLVENCCINNFDADTEEQSMDIEPMAHTSYNESADLDLRQIKEEANSSNEFTSDTLNLSNKQITPLESLRPINVINYGSMSANFNEDLDHRELVDLENVSKNKQYVNMINDNYFGDNIYADYFTPDRVESFESRETENFDQASQRESFVIPSYDSNYKIVENANCTNYTMTTEGVLEEVEFCDEGDCEVETVEQDSKLDVLSESRSESVDTLDICANEKMPPRGELSGQESNGDMDAPWNGIYSDVTPSEPYDLMAREAWISDSSDMDARDRHNYIDVEIALEKPILQYSCTHCDIRFPTLKELNAHHTLLHTNSPKNSHARADNKTVKHPLTNIKKEDEKSDITMLPDASTDIKDHINARIIFEDIKDTKPNINELIKKEPRKRKDYVCPTCKVDQLTDIGFREHLKIHPLECLTCGKCFYKRANLNLHMRMHLGIRNFKCEVCEKRFATRQKLQEHQNGHTGRTPYRCTYCPQSFRRYSNMVQHRDRHHLKKKPKQRDYVCHCGELLHSRAKLLWHAETHSEKPRACPYCSDRFVHAASLTRHIRRAHNAFYVPVGRKYEKMMENVPCPICKQVYLRYTLKSHLLTHSGKRPYLCHICNKTFTTNWNLKLHRWIHMSRSSKPYKCNLCKGAFIRHADYVSHMNAHKSVRPYTCNYCGCQFIRKYNCQRHVKEHEMAKKFVCKVPDCGKSFHRSYYLTEHMRVHSGARPYSCNICGKTSSNKSNHNKHVKVHHSRDPIATEA